MFIPLENPIVCGYKLLDLTTHYELHWRKGVFRGDLKKITTYAVLELGFETDEIELAVLEMNKHFHNGSEFGMMRRFMFTFETNETNMKLH
jgi:hypothetical protein